MTPAADTRTRILDAAEDQILRRGYAGTSLAGILESVDLTKGAFFHHFDSKQDLARALIRRYSAADRELLEATLARAERETADPLEQVLLLVDSMAETMGRLSQPYPGCLFASYCYQEGLFDEEIQGVVEESLLRWREALGGKLAEAMERHPTAAPLAPEVLADSFLALVEGAFILSKSLDEPGVVAEQLRGYRHHLELVFGVAEEARTGSDGRLPARGW